MRPLSRLITKPQPALILKSNSRSTSRYFSTSQPFRLREGTEQDPDDLEKKKQQAQKGEKPRDLQSGGEEAVGADQEKVKDDQKHIEDLQKQTANESQKNHPKGQN